MICRISSPQAAAAGGSRFWAPPAPCKRKRRRPEGGGELFRAKRPNHVWALDFQFDETADHRRLKLLNIVDEPPVKPWPCGWAALSAVTGFPLL